MLPAFIFKQISGALPALFLLSALMASGCVQSRVRFESDVKTAARLVNLENIDSVGEPLGELPVTLPMRQLPGKAVKLESAGKPAHYWFFVDQSSEIVTIKDNFTASVSVTTGSGNQADHTEMMQAFSRQLLKAYDALNKRDYKTVEELTGNLARQNPGIAAPHIIRGAGYIYQGRQEEARAALELARSLDAENGDIDLMLKALK